MEDLDKENFGIFRKEAIRSKRMTKADLDMSSVELLDSLSLLKDGKLTRADMMLYGVRTKLLIHCLCVSARLDG